MGTDYPPLDLENRVVLVLWVELTAGIDQLTRLAGSERVRVMSAISRLFNTRLVLACEPPLRASFCLSDIGLARARVLLSERQQHVLRTIDLKESA